jgi:DNA-binding transcriptional LysR family regulator
MTELHMADPDPLRALHGADLEGIRKFLVVAEELNFTRAAQRLGMAQPPLSAAIGQLERRLGVRLLERTSRQVTLTPAGTVLAEQGRGAMERLGAAVERTRRAGARPDTLTVAVKAGGATGLLRDITRRCAQDPLMPELHLLLGYRGGPAAAVRSGAADVAIAHGPFDQHGLDTEHLLTEPRVAVLPADHRLARHQALCRADLAGEPMPRWAGSADDATAAWWAGGDDGPGTRTPPGGPAVSDMNQLLEAVALGQAVAYVPASVGRRNRGGDLAFVPVTDLDPSEVVAAWPRGSRSRAVAGFVRAAVQAAGFVSSGAVSFRIQE